MLPSFPACVKAEARWRELTVSRLQFAVQEETRSLRQVRLKSCFHKDCRIVRGCPLSSGETANG